MLDGSQFLKELRSSDPHLALLLSNIIDGINGVGNHIGVDPTGKVQPPDEIQAINVKAGDSHVHVTLNDPSAVRKGVQYFVEWDTDPSFPAPHPEHLGAARGRMLALPSQKDDGSPISYYFRAYSQYHGSDAQSKKAVFGGTYSAAPVTLSGTSKLTPLPSQGSGTALADGTQGGLGLGTDLERLPVGPKVPVPPRVF